MMVPAVNGTVTPKQIPGAPMWRARYSFGLFFIVPSALFPLSVKTGGRRKRAKEQKSKRGKEEQRKRKEEREKGRRGKKGEEAKSGKKQKTGRNKKREETKNGKKQKETAPHRLRGQGG
ncbi:MAG: hypothetical protein SOZ43_06745 [Eubacteriales bacterium]|nr:hypothetical protein [Eubacteriales bacterium]